MKIYHFCEDFYGVRRQAKRDAALTAISELLKPSKSGVELRLPPHSKITLHSALDNSHLDRIDDLFANQNRADDHDSVAGS